MAVDMFLKIDTVSGETADTSKTQKDAIDIVNWNWGMTQTGTTHVGQGGGAGKVNVQDIHITKYTDKSSPVLMSACCTGKHFKNALLTVRKAGGADALEYIKLTLEDVMVTSVTTGGNSGSDERLTETVTLNFSRFKFEYHTQTATGGAGPGSSLGYNIAGNTLL